ncbi:hypothetical protein LTR86_006099 [Recurvomyces mirabilis]|nr:hypothetical protein LTR86_006099 [Recurvomyces mirabilis]
MYTGAIQLRADLYNAPQIPTNLSLPGGEPALWQPTVLTLISGPTEAALVDVLFTMEQGVAIGDWLDEILGDKTLTTIYITHGHGDHWFNLHYLLARFPSAVALSTQESIDHMTSQVTGSQPAFWQTLWPGQIDPLVFDPDNIPVKPLDDNKFVIDGHTLEAINVGHSDTDNTTFLYASALDLAVTGDIVYNDVHLWMAESATEAQRDAWVKSLDELEAFHPGVVIASHHRLGGVDGAFNIEATRGYITTFGQLVKTATNANELYEKVLAAYPDRLGFVALWLGCMAQYQ